MKWNENLLNIRDLLASLYPTPQDASRILDESGLDRTRIGFDSRAINTWHSVIEFAVNQSMLDKIIDEALGDYPGNTLLQLARVGALTGIRGPDIGTLRWDAPENEDFLEKIIGSESTLLPISFLEAGAIASKPVCRIVRSDGCSGTGFLVSPNLLLTNNHVLQDESQAEEATTEFNFQRTSEGLDCAIEKYSLLPSKLFYTSKDHDWTVVQIDPASTKRWGTVEFASEETKVGARVSVIQHPSGGPKQVALHHNIVVFVDKTRLQYLTDTMPGSSGSPIFNDRWKVVGVHHSGGFLREPGTKKRFFRNEGINASIIKRALGLLISE
jgi:V8-like Glu-specific endopeptidase